MGLLSFLNPKSWALARAEQVTWEGGWPQNSPSRTLKEFWLSEHLTVKPTRLPLGTLAKKVMPCVDVDFHFGHGRIVIDRARVCGSTSPNCMSMQGESFDAVSNFFDRGVLESVLQREADTKQSSLRACVFRVMAKERETAGLSVPRRGRRG
jgi:hypothetical protein